jgi:hypothetical protein
MKQVRGREFYAPSAKLAGGLLNGDRFGGVPNVNIFRNGE